METKSQTVNIADITHDESLQMRDRGIDPDFVETLGQTLREDDAAQLDPVTLFAEDLADGTRILRLADGFHRFYGYHYARRKTIPAEIIPGGLAAALKHALGANADQRAKPRTRRDLRKAVETALHVYYFASEKSNNVTKFHKLSNGQRLNFSQIAEICKTTKMTVSRIAKALQAETAPPAKAPSEPPRPVQETFFDILDRAYEPVAKAFENFVQHTAWLDPDIPREEKLKGLKDIIHQVDYIKRKLREREQQLIKQTGS